jgi:hypothetical protein
MVAHGVAPDYRGPSITVSLQPVSSEEKNPGKETEHGELLHPSG